MRAHALPTVAHCHPNQRGVVWQSQCWCMSLQSLSPHISLLSKSLPYWMHLMRWELCRAKSVVFNFAPFMLCAFHAYMSLQGSFVFTFAPLRHCVMEVVLGSSFPVKRPKQVNPAPLLLCCLVALCCMVCWARAAQSNSHCGRVCIITCVAD